MWALLGQHQRRQTSSALTHILSPSLSVTSPCFYLFHFLPISHPLSLPMLLLLTRPKESEDLGLHLEKMSTEKYLLLAKFWRTECGLRKTLDIDLVFRTETHFFPLHTSTHQTLKLTYFKYNIILVVPDGRQTVEW